MARDSRQLLRLLSICPICFDQAGALAGGARAGAAVLAIAAAVVVLALARFAVRLVKASASADVNDGEPRDRAC
jgi:hypothetical protein